MGRIPITFNGHNHLVELFDAITVEHVTTDKGQMVAFLMAMKAPDERITHAICLKREVASQIMARLNVCLQNLPV